jgi:hypothetical protein
MSLNIEGLSGFLSEQLNISQGIIEDLIRTFTKCVHEVHTPPPRVRRLDPPPCRKNRRRYHSVDTPDINEDDMYKNVESFKEELEELKQLQQKYPDDLNLK